MALGTVGRLPALGPFGLSAAVNLNFAMAAPAGREAPIMSRSRQSRGA